MPRGRGARYRGSAQANLARIDRAREDQTPGLASKDGDAPEVRYRHILETLGKRDGMLGVVFRKARNKIQDPAKLRRLIADLIDRDSP